MELRQRLAAGSRAAWQLIGRLSQARHCPLGDEIQTNCRSTLVLQCRCETESLVGIEHSPKALDPTSGRSAVLGRNALGSRATAIKPDAAYVL